VNRTPPWLRCLLSALAALAVVLGALDPRSALAAVPPLVGHVVDVPGALSGAERSALDAKLEHARRTRGLTVVVLVAGPLDPAQGTIDDVAYEAFNTWGVGAKGKDDGVLLVVAPTDRKLRIETGKGVGGALTDVQSSHINRDIIGPELRAGRVYNALDRGTDAILEALAKDAPAPAPVARRKSPLENPVVVAVIVVVVLLVIVLSIVSRTFRTFFFAFLRIFWFLLSVFSGRGGGGGGGYTGGGGRSGGGGSSDDY